MDASIIRSFLALVTEGLGSPRAVVRRIIDARPDLAERLSLVGLAAALQGTLWAFMTVLAPGLALGFGGHVVLALSQFVNYALTSTLAFHIGRRFGGSGEPTDVATAVAWHAVLAAALTPLQAAAVGGGGTMGGAGALMLLAYAVLNVWFLGACVAEAHRFASTRQVAAATAILFLLIGLTLSILLGSLRTA